MKLEDAFIYVVLGDDQTDHALVETGTAAIAGGADVLQVNGRATSEALRRLHDTCRAEEVLLVVRGNVDQVRELDADGLHLSSGGMDFGIARAVLDERCLIGLSSHTLDDARLAIEVGADYLLHHAGADCTGAFAALRHEAHVPLFAAGLTGLGDAEILVRENIFRLCLETDTLNNDDIAEQVATYSRLLGRLI